MTKEAGGEEAIKIMERMRELDQRQGTMDGTRGGHKYRELLKCTGKVQKYTDGGQKYMKKYAKRREFFKRRLRIRKI